MFSQLQLPHSRNRPLICRNNPPAAPADQLPAGRLAGHPLRVRPPRCRRPHRDRPGPGGGWPVVERLRGPPGTGVAPRARQGFYRVTGLARCRHCREAMVSGGKVNGNGQTVFACARRRAYGHSRPRAIARRRRSRAWRRRTANYAGACAGWPWNGSRTPRCGILGDDAWAEAALALRAEHIPPYSALNAILRTVVRRGAAYRVASGGRGRPAGRSGGEPVRGAARLGGRPLGRENAATRPAAICLTSRL